MMNKEKTIYLDGVKLPEEPSEFSFSQRTDKEYKEFSDKLLERDKKIYKAFADIEEEFENEEWSKPYTDVNELFRDLGLYD